MSNGAPHERIAISWAAQGRADLRSIDRDTALQVLRCLDRYLLSRDGDVKKLQHPQTGFRLRCGDYRLFFDFLGEDAIEITAVRNRREAYR